MVHFPTSELHVEVSRLVRAPRVEVFEAYTDFASIPKWSAQFSSVKVTNTEGAKVRIETEGSGRQSGRVSVAELLLYPPETVESESETRFTRTKRVVRFEDVPDGTKVTAILDVRVKGAWAWFLSPRGREEAQESAEEGLASFSRYAEELLSQRPTNGSAADVDAPRSQ